MRLFVALHLGGDIRERLSRIQETLRGMDARGSIRWVPPDSIHLTLRFLGETPDPEVPGLASGLGSSLEGQPAPRLALAGPGGFPSLSRPQVIWVGLQGDLRGLCELQRRVEAAVTAYGWAAEKRAFQPHLTLGRVRDPKRPLDRRLKRAIVNLQVEEKMNALGRLSLVRSHLGPRGARYEEIASWELDP